MPTSKEDAERLHSAQRDFISKINEATIKSGESALKACLVINGGAIVSLLAFLGGILTRDTLAIKSIPMVLNGLEWFAYGVFFSALATGLSYVVNYLTVASANSFLHTYEFPYIIETKKTKWLRWSKRLLHAVTLVAGFGSIGSFLLGILQVRDSLSLLAN